MQDEPTGPLSPDEDPEDVAALLRRQVAHLKRWVEWELWLCEPRSFAPPKESAPDDVRNECGEKVRPDEGSD